MFVYVNSKWVCLKTRDAQKNVAGEHTYMYIVLLANVLKNNDFQTHPYSIIFWYILVYQIVSMSCDRFSKVVLDFREVLSKNSWRVDAYFQFLVRMYLSTYHHLSIHPLPGCPSTSPWLVTALPRDAWPNWPKSHRFWHPQKTLIPWNTTERLSRSTPKND